MITSGKKKRFLRECIKCKEDFRPKGKNEKMCKKCRLVVWRKNAEKYVGGKRRAILDGF